MDSKDLKIYQIIKVEDVSHLNAKRYNCEILIEQGLSREQIKGIITEATEQLKVYDEYRNSIMKKRWQGEKAQCIWLCIADNIKKIKTPYPEWLCLSLWIDPLLPDVFRPMGLGGDDKIMDIEVLWCNG